MWGYTLAIPGVNQHRYGKPMVSHSDMSYNYNCWVFHQKKTLWPVVSVVIASGYQASWHPSELSAASALGGLGHCRREFEAAGLSGSLGGGLGDMQFMPQRVYVSLGSIVFDHQRRRDMTNDSGMIPEISRFWQMSGNPWFFSVPCWHKP